MKFVALAFALLLAVGSQAASLQVDAPTMLQHARSAIDRVLAQLVISGKSVAAQLEGTQFEPYKDTIQSGLDEVHSQIKGIQASVSPITDTLVEVTAELRASLVDDIEALISETEVGRAKLREVVDRHIGEYRSVLQGTIDTYKQKYREMIMTTIASLESVKDELQAKFATNVEETKSTLQPILDTVYVKISMIIKKLKDMADPYIVDYKEQLEKTLDSAKAMSPEEIAAVKAKLEALATTVKTDLMAIFATLMV